MLSLAVDYFYTSPYALSVYVALKEKGLSFSLKTIQLHKQENRSEDFVKSSLTARVPLLLCDDFALSESNAIDEFIDEKFPGAQRLYPQDIYQRARARQIQAFVRSDLMPIREQLSSYTVFYPQYKSNLDGSGQSAAEKLFAFCNALISPNQAFLFNDWCIADCDLAMMLMRLVANQQTIPLHLKDYALRQWQRKSIQEWCNLQRPDYVGYTN